MSKITFRADEDLIERIEGLDASKSEIMRNALRAYLGLDLGRDLTLQSPDHATERSVNRDPDREVTEALSGSIEEIDLTIRIAPSVDNHGTGSSVPSDTEDLDEVLCSQCGESVDVGHAHCPNCGHPRSRRVVCECGSDLHSQWSFCPECGRRTPTVDVLDQT